MIQNWNGQHKDFTNRKSLELPNGGKDPIERICAAYGFTSRQALCRHLNVSQSTMANRVTRGNFPADWVLICAMETGAPLEWLVYGQGTYQPNIPTAHHMESGSSDVAPDNMMVLSQMEHLKIHNGIIKYQKETSVPSSFLPVNAISPRLVDFDGIQWIVDSFIGELVDGYWLIEMDGITSIREIYRLPGERIRVENGKASFECNASDVKILGKVIGKIEFME